MSIQYSEEHWRIHIVKFLQKTVDLPNEFPSLLKAIRFHAIVRLQGIPKMLHSFNPWQGVTIKYNWSHTVLVKPCLGEHHTLSLRLAWVRIGAELESSQLGKLLTHRYHSLKA